MNSWLVKKLGDMISHKKGFAFKSEWFQTSGVPVVKVTNFTDSSVDTHVLVYVDKNIAEEKKEYKLNGGDVVIQTVGSWPNNPESVVGKVIRIPAALNNSLLNQNAVIFRPKDGLRGDYLFYLLKDKNFKGYIINTAQGAANQASITLDSIFRFEFYMPPVEVQRRIAAILSAYDDLIENNKRRIALLEKMAEEIYREWFVRTRFPGYEKVKFEKRVPEGWEIKPYSEVVDINPFEKLYDDDYKPYVGMENLSTNSMYFSYTGKRKGKAGSKFRNDDVLLPRITPCLENGKRGYVMALAKNEVGLGSTEFIVMRRKELFPEHIYFLTCSDQFRKHAEISMAGASGRQRVQENCFSFFLVKVPPEELRLKSRKIISPFFSKIRLLNIEIINLSKTRDLLLSRLISGKLPVEALDIRFPPSMQNEQDVDHA